MTKLEREIEAKLRKVVEAHGGLCVKWVCPGWAGVPDRLILLPGGTLMFVELKRPKGGEVSPLQRWWQRKLSSLGFDCWFIFNDKDITTLELVILDRLNGQRCCR